MKIVIGEVYVNHENNKNLTGKICLKYGNKYFPENNWSDFPVIVLSWWINNFINVIKQNSKDFEFCFMDGPFAVTGTLTSNKMYKMKLLKQNLNDNEVIEIMCASPKEIQNMLLDACIDLFRELNLKKVSKIQFLGLMNLFNELDQMTL